MDAAWAAQKGFSMNMTFQQTMTYLWTIATPTILRATVVTIQLWAITIVLAVPLGLPIAFGEISKIAPMRWICKLYVFIFRGTPLILQLWFFYFFFPIALNITLPAFPTAALPVVLTYAAYFAEIYRGGINSIDHGQYEASHSLGLSKTQEMFDIVIPQMMRVVLPGVANEAILLIKDTALASVITLQEIMRVSESMVNRDFVLAVYVVAAIVYMFFTFITQTIADKVEKHFSKYDEREE